MAMKPLSAWIKDYEPKNKDSFDTQLPFWGKWVDANAQGIQSSPPYQSNGTTNEGSFTSALGSLSSASDPASSAAIIAGAWQTWYLGITFSSAPPAPPFSAIFSITPSPVGTPIAYAALLAGLIAELAVTPPDPTGAFLIKGTAFATLFYTATVSAGVQIDGLSTGTPSPLSLPLVPVV